MHAFASLLCLLSLTLCRQGYIGGRSTLANDVTGQFCHPGEEYAIIIHGWKESCDNTEWVSLLASSRCTFALSLQSLAAATLAPLLLLCPRSYSLPRRLYNVHGLLAVQ